LAIGRSTAEETRRATTATPLRVARVLELPSIAMSRSFTRRALLRGGLAAAALGLACRRSSPPARSPAAGSSAEAPPAKRKILILGGTGFLGPKTIAAAVARGHEVTIFNRGKREKLQPLEHEVEHLYGNRDPELPADDERGPDGALLRPEGSPRGLEQLRDRSWDVVIDNSGFFPRMVKASAELLAPNAGRYIFISSISVYDDIPATGGDETARLAELADPTVETMGASFENYGGLKVLCERAATAAFGDRATIVRPGYIVGPGDPTDRFTYWPVRIARGGPVLAPGAPDDPLQWIDVRDLADWLIELAERDTPGTFNAVGPAAPGRWGDVLETCVARSRSDARLVWVPATWLEQHAKDAAFPIWAPATGETAGFHRWSNARAKTAGLSFRSLDDTIEALLAWYPDEIARRVRVTKELARAASTKAGDPPKLGDPQALRAGPSAERERELVAAFQSKTP
jgi:2'-hydroxyisoflavone reductase